MALALRPAGAVGVGGHPGLSICFASRPGVPKLHSHSRPHVLEITLRARPCDDFSWLALPCGNGTGPAARHPLSLRAGRVRRPRVSPSSLTLTLGRNCSSRLLDHSLMGPTADVATPNAGWLPPHAAHRGAQDQRLPSSVCGAPREPCVCAGPSDGLAWRSHSCGWTNDGSPKMSTCWPPESVAVWPHVA